MPPSLRLFPGPSDPGEDSAPRSAVPLGDLLAVAGAHAGRAWLGDFASERVLVSADLADVLYAAKAMHVGHSGTDPHGRRRAA